MNPLDLPPSSFEPFISGVFSFVISVAIMIILFYAACRAVSFAWGFAPLSIQKRFVLRMQYDSEMNDWHRSSVAYKMSAAGQDAAKRIHKKYKKAKSDLK